MNYCFAERMSKTPRSFIRETLKVTEQPDIISFAGGLPNPTAFPITELAHAVENVMKEEGVPALQYATTEGFLPLRKWISERYKKRYNINISPEEILITHGSQQSLDLCGKVLMDKGTRVAIERPGYLGAIQAFSIYEPQFYPVNLNSDGPDLVQLHHCMDTDLCKIFYGVPNSQNPSGVTWSDEKRRKVADYLKDYDSLFIEDDAYGEIRFSNVIPHPVKASAYENVIMNGTFSKIVSPGMRMGWICAPKEIMTHLITAKQATDLHSSIFAQRIIYRYLTENSVDQYIQKISDTYRELCICMVGAIKEMLPPSITFSVPDGGMFIWLTLPAGCSSLDLFNKALEQHVAILPGIPFYTDGGGENNMRLNFTNSTPEQITEGIRRLSLVLKKMNVT
jgi:2-aminoadipate transaminase